MLDVLKNAVLLLGATLVVLGFWMIYAPAGVIVCGVLLIVAVVIDELDDMIDGSDGTR